MATPQHRNEPGTSPSPRPHRAEPAPDVAAPPHGLPLGLVLGLVLALAVAVVLGGITGFDVHQELVMEREMREARLGERFAELAGGLAAVERRAELHAILARAREHAVQAMGGELALELSDETGRRVTAAPDGNLDPPPGALTATIDVDCPALPGGSGRLTIWQDGAALAADRARLWRDWAMDLLLTSLAVILAVEFAVHFLVGRPLRRLVRGLRRLERGHLGPIDPGPGAWEIRWLAWRFQRLGQEFSDNAQRLVAAERRSLDTSRLLAAVAEASPRASIVTGGGPSEVAAGGSAQTGLVRQYLEDTCRLLETLHPTDIAARDIARQAWTSAVVEAERLGDRDLKAQLEDGALRILEHDDFVELDAELVALRRRRRPWLQWVGTELTRALDTVGVPAIEIEQRVKHTAGVWRKMRESQLAVDEVHDLFAFRIIVATEPECYLVLAAIHRLFEPEPFRFKDYIEFPKPNGYRSLHTTVRDAEGRLFEVQIRTRGMHEAAESGGAAHWQYRTERWGSLDPLRPPRPLYRRLFGGRWLFRR
ncbi:MAG: hypothetical protein PVG53_12625 [Holophagae bacterium]